MELTPTFMALLDGFHPVFTAPSFATFRLLMVGWILSARHRYVTDLIISSDSVGNGHFSDYHRFFSHKSGVTDEEIERVIAAAKAAVNCPRSHDQESADDWETPVEEGVGLPLSGS